MTAHPREMRSTLHTTSALIIGGARSRWRWAVHRDLPEGSGEAALRFVADHPSYALIHFGSIIGAVLWTMGLRRYPAVLDDVRARLVAQWASTVATIGAGVLAVQFSLDGYGLPASPIASQRRTRRRNRRSPRWPRSRPTPWRDWPLYGSSCSTALPSVCWQHRPCSTPRRVVGSALLD